MPLSGPMTEEERRKRLRAIQTQFGIGTPGTGIAPMQGDARTQPRLLTPSPVATGRVDTGLAGVRQPEPGMGRLFGEEALGTVRRGLSALGGATVLPLSFATAVGKRAGTPLDQPVRPFSEIHRETVGGVEEPMRRGLDAVRRGMAQVGMIPPSWAPATAPARQAVTPRGEQERVATGLRAAQVAQEEAAQAPVMPETRLTPEQLAAVAAQAPERLAAEQAAAEAQIPLSMAERADRVGPEGGILTPKGRIVSESDAQVVMMARQEADERAAALEREARTMRDREFQQGERLTPEQIAERGTPPRPGLGSGRVFNPITQQFDVAAPSTLVAAGTLGLPVRGGRMIDTETFRAPRIGAGLGSAREMRVAAGQGTGEERGTQERRGLRDRAEAELMAGAQERTAQREQERGLVGMTNESKERIAQIESGRMTEAEKKRAWEQEDMRGVVDGMIDQIFADRIRRSPKNWRGRDTGSGEIFINLADNQLEELSKADYEAHIKDPSKKPHLAPVPEEVREYWESGTKRSRA